MLYMHETNQYAIRDVSCLHAFLVRGNFMLHHISLQIHIVILWHNDIV